MRPGRDVRPVALYRRPGLGPTGERKQKPAPPRRLRLAHYDQVPHRAATQGSRSAIDGRTSNPALLAAVLTGWPKAVLAIHQRSEDRNAPNAETMINGFPCRDPQA